MKAIDRVDLIDGNLGELSAFHVTFGFYVHGVPIDTAVLPTGWEGRAIEVRNQNTRNYTGWCLEAHDLATSKLAAFRDKDRDFVRTLLVEKLIDPSKLRRGLDQLAKSSQSKARVACRNQSVAQWYAERHREAGFVSGYKADCVVKNQAITMSN